MPSLNGKYLIRNKETGMWVSMKPRTEGEIKAFFSGQGGFGMISTEGRYEVYALAERRVMIETKIIIC